MLNKACQILKFVFHIYNYRYLTDLVILHTGNLCGREKAKKKLWTCEYRKKKGVTHWQCLHMSSLSMQCPVVKTDNYGNNFRWLISINLSVNEKDFNSPFLNLMVVKFFECLELVICSKVIPLQLAKINCHIFWKLLISSS